MLLHCRWPVEMDPELSAKFQAIALEKDGAPEASNAKGRR